MKAMLVDVSTCIGCRACQVACKEWNELPIEPVSALTGYESPGHLSGDTWKHVKFVDRAGDPGSPAPWQFYSDSCKHCPEAPCLDACPTGAISRNAEGFVLVDGQVCNGNQHCVPACPFDVIAVSPSKGIAQKCTFCHDRVDAGLGPACAKVCPTDAIRFGDRDALLERGRGQVARLRQNGHPDASLYGEHLLGGLRVLTVLPDPPEVYGLPDPATVERPAHRLLGAWIGVAAAAAFWMAILLQLLSGHNVGP